MDNDFEFTATLRTAAQETGDEGYEALAWRELLETAADEIDRLRTLVERNNNRRVVGARN
jgi:hypothetical protein